MTLKLTVKHRDRLFFDQYKYCAVFRQTEVSCVRGLDLEQFRRTLNYRKRWNGTGYNGSRQINQQDEDNLYETFNFLSSAPDPIKITISWHWCYVYSNNLDWLSTIEENCKGARVNAINEAVISRPRGTIALIEPKYHWRTYFRERAVEPAVKKRIADWINAQGTEIHPSPALGKWLKLNNLADWRTKYMQRHYYVEHNDPKFDTMINLVMPGCVRSTVSVQTRAK